MADPALAPWPCPLSTTRSGTSRRASWGCRCTNCSARSAPPSRSTGSGGFTTYNQDQLTAQLGGWLDDGIRAVKIKIGEAWGIREGRDLDRVEQTLSVVSGAGRNIEVFVDANGGYTVGQAVRIGHVLDALGVTWFEEP